MIENKKTLLSMVVALALTACGGGGGGSTPDVTSATTSTGQVVDGYLDGATVLCDTNNNGVADTGEMTATAVNGTFTFAAACSSTIVAFGGISTDTKLAFKGRLKAPAGSKVATPLTSLMATGGLTAAQVAVALGLPAGTDVTKLDPITNVDLQKKTLAMQQVIQQITNTLGALAGGSSDAAIQAIYSEVAKAVVATLAANPTAPLVNSSGTVDVGLVSGIVKQSVTNLESTTDTSLAAVKTSMGSFSAVSVSGLLSSAIANQAETLAKASDADLVGLATSVQSNPSIANAASGLASFLTGKVALADLAGLAAGLKDLSDTNTSNDAAASAKVSSEVTTQAAKAGIPAPTIDTGAWSTPAYLALQDDSIELNGTNYTLTQFMSSTGVVLTKKVSPLDTVSFGFAVNGTPIPKNASGVMTTTVSLGAELTDTGSSGRVLQFILDKADVTLSSTNQLSVSVPAGAKLYAYGKTSSGTTATVTLTNFTADQFMNVTTGNRLEFNAGKVLAKITAGQSLFSGLQNITGTFNMKVTMSNLAIRSKTDGAVKALSVSVTGSGQPAVSGLGVQGKFTVN